MDWQRTKIVATALSARAVPNIERRAVRVSNRNPARCQCCSLLQSNGAACKRLAVHLVSQFALDKSPSSTSRYGHAAVRTRTIASRLATTANERFFLHAIPFQNPIVSKASRKQLVTKELLPHSGESAKRHPDSRLTR